MQRRDHRDDDVLQRSFFKRQRFGDAPGDDKDFMAELSQLRAEKAACLQEERDARIWECLTLLTEENKRVSDENKQLRADVESLTARVGHLEDDLNRVLQPVEPSDDDDSDEDGEEDGEDDY